jgi:indole-3-pyruvate monooxygenase
LERLDAIVVGAGFAGLGTAAALRARGVTRFALLEQGGQAGHFWAGTYDRIHLHSAFHDMPNDGALRRRYPIFLARDQLLDYFRSYAELHALERFLRLRTRVERVSRLDPRAHDGCEWLLETTQGPLAARTLAIATAVNRVPKRPEIAGQESFGGRVLHSAAYREPKPFAGRDVLVVGSGNSAAEISLDLVEGGARSVAMWVRAPRHFIPLSRMALLFRLFRALGFLSEPRVAAMHKITWGTPAFDAEVARRDKLARRLSVDLSRFGIRMPADGPMAETFSKGRIPTFDVGAIRHIKSGAIRVIDGNARPIESFTADGVRFGDGDERFDDVVLATGYEPRVEEFVAVPELLGAVREWTRFPITDGRSRSTVVPSIWFPGFDRSPLGGHSLGRWGWEAGEAMAEALRA